MRYYNLFLPVYKQGDDLASCLDDNKGDPVKGFLDLAEQYNSAAQICREVADVLALSKTTHVQADTHFIGLELDPIIAEPLVEKGLLREDEEEELDDEESEDEEEND